MNKKILIVLISVMCLVAIGVLLVFNDKENPEMVLYDKNNNSIKQTEKYIVNPVKYEITSAKNLRRNANVPLSVGQEFRYYLNKYDGGYGNETYNVERIEIIEGKVYYVVRVNKEGVFKSDDGSQHIEFTQTIYYDKDNGSVLKLLGLGKVLTGDDAEITISESFFASWMLALDDNFKWKQEYTYTIGEKTKKKSKEYEVVNRDKVEGIECFKVKVTTISNPEEIIKKITYKSYLWIDAKKRILIKSEYWSKGNLRTSETNLVSEL